MRTTPMLMTAALVLWTAAAQAQDGPPTAAEIVELYYTFQGGTPDIGQVAAGLDAVNRLLAEGHAPTALQDAVVRVFSEVAAASTEPFEAVLPDFVRAQAAASAPPPAATGGCGSDRDCKGDRICENGRCVEPAHGATRSSASPRLPPDVDWDYVLQKRRGARTYATLSWVLNGLGSAAAVTAVIWGAADEDSATTMAGIGVGATAFWIAGIPLASASHLRARRAYEMMGVERASTVPRDIAWGIYAGAIAFGAAATATAIAEVGYVSIGLGAGAISCGVTAWLMMQMYASKGLRMVREPLEAAGRAERLPPRRATPRLVGVFPAMTRERDGAAGALHVVVAF